MEPVASARRLTLCTELGPPAFVHCDADRVEQVLVNLIDNAVKFAPEGGAIHVRTHRTEDEVVVSVRDTGVGIAEDQIAHLFTRYWQGDRGRQPSDGAPRSRQMAAVSARGCASPREPMRSTVTTTASDEQAEVRWGMTA